MRLPRRTAVTAAAMALAVASLPLATGAARAVCGGSPPPPTSPPPPAGEVPENTRDPQDPTVTGGTETAPPPPPSIGGGTGGPPTTTGAGDGGDGGTPRGGSGGPPPGGPAPTGGGAGGVTTGRERGVVVFDRDDWKYWWFANRTEILDFRARAIAKAAATAEAGGGPRPGDEMWRALAQGALTQALADPERDVVAAAAVALGKSGDTGETRSLVRLLADRGAPDVVRVSAALGLGLLVPARDDASTAARDALRGVARDGGERPQLRASAVYALGERREEESVPALVDLARSGGAEWDVPSAALSALGVSGCGASRPELERLLSPPKKGRDREWMRRVYAAHGLARLGDRAAIPALAEALGDDHPDVRRAAVLALGALGRPEDAELVARLEKVLDDDRDGPCRNMAALTLGRMGGPGVTKAIRRAYDTGEPVQRTYAAIALGFVLRRADDPAVRKFLVRELEERSMLELRGALAVACGIGRVAAAAPELRRIAGAEGDPALRGHAAIALGLIGDAEAAPFLTAILGTKADPALHGEAALALGLLGERSAIPALAAQVERGSTHRAQAAAAVALGRIGGAQAADLFSRLLGDRRTDAEVRESAAIGLGLLLDRREGRTYTAVGADLDWYATTATVREVLDIH